MGTFQDHHCDHISVTRIEIRVTVRISNVMSEKMGTFQDHHCDDVCVLLKLGGIERWLLFTNPIIPLNFVLLRFPLIPTSISKSTIFDLQMAGGKSNVTGGKGKGKKGVKEKWKRVCF